jgi:hypothetical protein
MAKLTDNHIQYAPNCPKCLNRGWYTAKACRVVLRRQTDGTVMPKSISEEFRRTCDCQFGDVWIQSK